MTTNMGSAQRGPAGDDATRSEQSTHRLTTETKASSKTTELLAYLAAVIGVLVASYLVEDTPGGRADYFLADKAWFYIVLLTIGYMISRGLAKSGSRDSYDHHDQ